VSEIYTESLLFRFFVLSPNNAQWRLSFHKIFAHKRYKEIELLDFMPISLPTSLLLHHPTETPAKILINSAEFRKIVF